MSETPPRGMGTHSRSARLPRRGCRGSRDRGGGERAVHVRRDVGVSATCAETTSSIPKARRGAIHYSFNASGLEYAALFENDFLPLMKQINCNAWEFAGNYRRSGRASPATPRPAGGSRSGATRETYGFRIVGTHDGPLPPARRTWGAHSQDERVGLQPARRGRRLSERGDQPPGCRDGDHESQRDLGVAGECAHHEQLGPGLPDQQRRRRPRHHAVRPGVFQGTALTAGRTCARYYRHFHSEQGKWIQNTGTKYDNHYISELIYTETDPFVAYAQSDQCWLLDGLWMAGGNAPSVGLQGPGDPNPGQGKNRLVQPDIMERWQDSVFSFHIKDLGGRTAGTTAATSATTSSPAPPPSRTAQCRGRRTAARTRFSSRRSTSASAIPSATSTYSNGTA